jgi:protein SCO1/2
MISHSRNDCEDNSSDHALLAASRVPRRKFLHALTATALGAVLPLTARAHGQMGVVRPPLALPATGMVMRNDGTRLPLQSILQGKTTALQLMFTGCSETCSLQGAVFAGVQQQLPNLAARNLQLLSLSIDSLGDDAKTLSAWMRRFGAGKGWVAAVPTPKDMDALQSVLQGPNAPRNNHSSRVYFINAQGLLVWRSEELPPAEVVTRIFEKISKT